MHGDWRQRAVRVGMTVAILIMVVMAASTISPRFRFELGAFFRYGRAQSLQHFFQYGILPNAQETFSYLGLRMPIPQMKRAAQEVMPGMAGYSVGRFVRRHDLHYPAIIAPEQIIVAQHGSTLGKDRNFLPRRKRGTQPAVLPQLVREYKLRENLTRF